jgi:acylphosphatase
MGITFCANCGIRMPRLVKSCLVKNDAVARRYVVSGRVQGVGYRLFVQGEAERLGLRGYVRNRRSGDVEVLAIGRPEKLEEFRLELHKGPMMSRVHNVDEQPAAVESQYADDFMIESTE